MEIVHSAVVLLALLVCTAWADRYDRLFKNITQSLDNSLESNRKKHEDILLSASKQHDELKSMIQYVSLHLGKVVEEDQYERVQNFTDEVKERIRELKKQTDEHNAEIQETRLQYTKEIKKLVLEMFDEIDPPTDCYELYELGNRNNSVYYIKPKLVEKSFQVYCDMEDGGWTVIQRRDFYATQKEDFYGSSWDKFREGFGNVAGEFWLGNEKIYRMTSAEKYTLKLDMKDFSGRTSHAVFRLFQLNADYSIRIGEGLPGQSGSIFLNIDGAKFQTNDRRICTSYHWGAWWYKTSCITTGNLNGNHGNQRNYDRITFDGESPLSYTVMKIKPHFLE